MQKLVLVGGAALAAWYLLRKKEVDPREANVEGYGSYICAPGLRHGGMLGQFGPRYIYAPGLRWGE